MDDKKKEYLLYSDKGGAVLCIPKNAIVTKLPSNVKKPKIT